MKKILIISIGDYNFGDDGIGHFILKELKSFPEIFKKADFIEWEKKSFDLIDYIKNREFVIIIDAVKMGLSPGEYKIFNLNQIKKNKNKKNLSLHEFGVIEILMLAESLNINIKNLYIFGIQPKNIEFGKKLSEELKQNLSVYIQEIQKIIEKRSGGLTTP